jgi:hypothetical protein
MCFATATAASVCGAAIAISIPNNTCTAASSAASTWAVTITAASAASKSN